MVRMYRCIYFYNQERIQIEMDRHRSNNDARLHNLKIFFDGAFYFLSVDAGAAHKSEGLIWYVGQLQFGSLYFS